MQIIVIKHDNWPATLIWIRSKAIMNIIILINDDDLCQFLNRFSTVARLHYYPTSISVNDKGLLANGLGSQRADRSPIVITGWNGEPSVTYFRCDNIVINSWLLLLHHNFFCFCSNLLSFIFDIQAFPQFWPDDSLNIESDHFRVKFLSKMNKCDYVCRDFVIQSIQDDYELNVRMLHCPSWPEMSSVTNIFDFIVDVHRRSNEYRNGPIVVVDR